MNELRRFLAGVFGFTAFILAWGIVAAARMGLHTWPGGTHPAAADLFLLGALVLNGAACWAILANKPLGRALGLAASVMPLLVLLALAYEIHANMHGVPWISGGLAIAGLIAFLPRYAVVQPTKPIAPISGDGTKPWVGKAVWIVGILGFFSGLNWWWRWAQAQDLPWGGAGVSFVSQLFLTDLIVVFIHELGHSITGLALGMKLRAFVVGPLQWHVYQGKWEFKFRPGGFFSAGGVTGLVPTNPRRSVWEQVCMIAAGPFFSLTSGVLAVCAALSASGRAWEPAWFLLACIATASLLVGILNFVPLQTRGGYSDGALIYQLLSGGPWADYHRVIAIMGSTLVTPLRPRDYDIDAIQRAASVISNGHMALHFHMLGSSYHLDRGEFREAALWLSEAELIFQRSELKAIPAGWCAAITFDKAMLHHDAQGARRWWERMQSEKPIRFKVDYWLGQAALLWIEKKIDEARAAWEKANDFAQKMPGFGAYDFDRYRCALLHKAIDEPSAGLANEPISLNDPSTSPAL